MANEENTPQPRSRGGPKPGSKRRSTIDEASRLLVAHAEPIARRTIEQAMSGDVAAAGLVLDLALRVQQLDAETTDRALRRLAGEA